MASLSFDAEYMKLRFDWIKYGTLLPPNSVIDLVFCAIAESVTRRGIGIPYAEHTILSDSGYRPYEPGPSICVDEHCIPDIIKKLVDNGIVVRYSSVVGYEYSSPNYITHRSDVCTFSSMEQLDKKNTNFLKHAVFFDLEVDKCHYMLGIDVGTKCGLRNFCNQKFIDAIQRQSIDEFIDQCRKNVSKGVCHEKVTDCITG